MESLSPRDLALYAVAGFIAIVVLVKLMRSRRDQLLAQVREQMEQEKRRKLIEQKRSQKAEKKPQSKAS